MSPLLNNRVIPVLQAYLVTLLWSSSWVIIKYGLEDISPLMFASLRYLLASTILFLILMYDSTNREILNDIPLRWWLRLSFYGVIFITLTQGLQFLGLSLLPAITVSFLLNFTSILVVIFASILLKEVPNTNQILIIGISISGVIIFFYPFRFPTASVLGFVIVGLAVISNTFSTIFGRKYNRSKKYSPLIITTISMGIGSIFLFISAFLVEGFPIISFRVLIFILWLAIINTAFAFMLWNNAMRRLGAVQITLVNSTMLPQITILAIIFLNELPTVKEWIGISLIFFSGIAIQLTQTQYQNSSKTN